MTAARDRLRILIVAPFPPQSVGPHGGARAVAGAVGAIARRHDVGLVYVAASDGVVPDASTAAVCAFTEALPGGDLRLARRWGRRAAAYAGLAHGVPIWASDLRSRRSMTRVAALAQSWRPHVVQVELLATAILLDGLKSIPAARVLVDHDASDRPADAFEHLPHPLGGLMERADRLAWRRFERRVMQRVDATVVYSRRDRVAAERAGAQVVEIPLVVSVPRRRLDPVGQRPPMLLFAGYYRHPPNLDAALWLATRLFPKVLRRHSEAVLYLVGHDPPPELQRLAGDHVVVTGAVPDVTPYLDRAAVVVAPIRTGGGVRVKVLEALASGKAVVATPLAAEGIDAVPDRELMIAESEDAFADAISALLADIARRRRMAASAYEWAREHVGFAAAEASYAALYERLLADRRANRDSTA